MVNYGRKRDEKAVHYGPFFLWVTKSHLHEVDFFSPPFVTEMVL